MNGATAEVMGKSGSRRGGLAPLLGDRWRKKPLSGKGFGGVEAGGVWSHGEIEEIVCGVGRELGAVQS